jgi:hypothetical protein
MEELETRNDVLRACSYGRAPGGSRGHAPARLDIRLPLTELPPAVRDALADAAGITLQLSPPRRRPALPCHRTAVVADPPNGMQPSRQTSLPAFGCSWPNPAGALMVALKVVHHQFGSAEERSISVEVTAEQMLTFEIEGKDLRDSCRDTDRCGGVAKMAEFVIDNLRHS